jgi:YL1 nuclear protein C-terminal domain
LRRRRVEGPIWRFVSRRVVVEEVVPVEEEPEVEIMEVEMKVVGEGEEVKAVQGEGEERVTNGVIGGTGDGDKMIVDNEPEGSTLPKEEKLGDTSSTKEDNPEDSASPEVNIDKSPKDSGAKSPEPEKEASKSTPQSPKPQSPTSPSSHHESEKMDIDQDHESTKDESTKEVEIQNDPVSEPSPQVPKSPQHESDEKPTDLTPEALQPENQEPPSPKSPPPYELANYTHNTLTLVPLPTQPILPLRETFFPDLRSPPPKPKPAARCPITGLQVRYKDPLTGVGYYDIHAFAILREVARPDGRYVWCDEGGWFVGEQGPTGRPAKGVPEGWFG